MGDTFTLSELQGVYEEVWDTEIDAANFRRSLGAPPGRRRPPSPPAAAAMSAPPPEIAALRSSTPASPGDVDDESYVTPTGERAKSSDKGGRPPELFKKGGAWKDEPPIRRPRSSKRRPRSD